MNQSGAGRKKGRKARTMSAFRFPICAALILFMEPASGLAFLTAIPARLPVSSSRSLNLHDSLRTRRRDKNEHVEESVERIGCWKMQTSPNYDIQNCMHIVYVYVRAGISNNEWIWFSTGKRGTDGIHTCKMYDVERRRMRKYNARCRHKLNI